MDVLDVACGTGVLFPDNLKRCVESVTGIDISPEMARLAAEKFPQVQVICGDVNVVISNDRMYQVAGTRREGEIHSHGGHSHCDTDTPMEG